MLRNLSFENRVALSSSFYLLRTSWHNLWSSHGQFSVLKSAHVCRPQTLGTRNLRQSVWERDVGVGWLLIVLLDTSCRHHTRPHPCKVPRPTKGLILSSSRSYLLLRLSAGARSWQLPCSVSGVRVCVLPGARWPQSLNEASLLLPPTLRKPRMRRCSRRPRLPQGLRSLPGLSENGHFPKKGYPFLILPQIEWK